MGYGTFLSFFLSPVNILLRLCCGITSENHCPNYQTTIILYSYSWIQTLRYLFENTNSVRYLIWGSFGAPDMKKLR